MSKERISEISMIIVTMIWGLGFPITQLAIDAGFGSYTIMFSRFVIAALLLPIIFYKRIKYLNKITIICGIITGLFLFIGFYFQTKGLEYTTSSKNAFITQSAVVITPFIVWILTKKKPDKYVFIAGFIAFLGVATLSLNPSDLSSFNKGDALTLLAAVGVSFHVSLTSYFINKYNMDGIMFTFIQMLFAAILSFIMASQFDTLPLLNNIPIIENSLTNILIFIFPLIFIGLFNTTLGFTVQTIAIKYTSPSRTSVIVSMEAVFGTIGAAIILSEPITLNVVVGGGLIIVALIISETKLRFLRKNNI